MNLDFSKIVFIRVDLFKKNSDFSRSGSGALSVLVLLLGLMHALYPRVFRRRSALVNYVYHKDTYVYGGMFLGCDVFRFYRNGKSAFRDFKNRLG